MGRSARWIDEDWILDQGERFVKIDFGTCADGVVVLVRGLDEVEVGYHVAGRLSWRETGYSRTSSFLLIYSPSALLMFIKSKSIEWDAFSIWGVSSKHSLMQRLHSSNHS